MLCSSLNKILFLIIKYQSVSVIKYQINHQNHVLRAKGGRSLQCMESLYDFCHLVNIYINNRSRSSDSDLTSISI